jgi:1-acyl-sn-glycerol-3-phosphate acyltransferase
MFMSEAPRADVVKLLDRKGFVRVAVEAGAPLVPIYVGAGRVCGGGGRDLGGSGFEGAARVAVEAGAPLVPIYVAAGGIQG